MSGLFGIVDTQNRGTIQRTLQRMAASLKLRRWYNAHTWIDPQAGVGLGQTNIGILRGNQQPARSTDGSIVALAFGEFYNDDGMPQIGSAAEQVLRLYQDRGDKLVSDLEGVFVLAVWDSRRQQLLLANDRYGLVPLYYAHWHGKLIFAPLVKGIFQDPATERHLNLTAVAEFFRFQRLLGDKTFFQGVHLPPYGSLLRFDAGSGDLSVTHYWDFDQIPPWRTQITFEQAVAEAGRLLRRSVDRLMSGPYRMGVYLSGGLDSRTILGFAREGDRPVTSITYGRPDSWDVIYAHRIARRLGSDHHFFPQPDGKWLADHIDFHLEVTEGHTTFIHAHAANTLEPARDLIDINLTGFNGDQLLGARAAEKGRPARTAEDEVSFLAATYRHFTQDFSWPGLTEAEEKLVFTPDFYPQVRDRAFESLARELAPFAQFPFARRLDYFTTIHQGIRLSHLNVVYQRAFVEARYPFCDYRLSDFMCAMPLDFRLGDRLYLALLNREIPQVTWVPRDTDNRLLTDRKLIRTVHGLLQKVKRRINRHILPIFADYPTIHGDPEDWLRRDLRDWAAAILFDERTLDRGIINPAFIRSIFDRHMSGREIWTIGKIAPIITFEMMLRRYYDETQDAERR